MSRTSGEHRARRRTAERSNGVCERCDQSRAVEWQHRVRRSQGGAWCPSNGVHLCTRCHSWVTQHPEQARAEGGWHLRRTDDPATYPARLAMHGWVLLRADGSVESCAAPDRSVA
jgi:hypothetical protein